MNADDFLRLATEVQERKQRRPSPYKTIPTEILRSRLYCSMDGCDEWRSTRAGLFAHQKDAHGRFR